MVMEWIRLVSDINNIMAQEQRAGTKFDEYLVWLDYGPKKWNDPDANQGLRPLLWAVDTELKSCQSIAIQIRRAKLRNLIIQDYNELGEEYRLAIKPKTNPAPIYRSTLLR